MKSRYYEQKKVIFDTKKETAEATLLMNWIDEQVKKNPQKRKKWKTLKLVVEKAIDKAYNLYF